jgi:hypothetical protein
MGETCSSCRNDEQDKNIDLEFNESIALSKNMPLKERKMHRLEKDESLMSSGFNQGGGAKLDRSSIIESHGPNPNKGDHRPSSMIAQEVSKMNPLSDKAQLVSYEMPPFAAQGEIQHLKNPVFGPYRYKRTGDTYKGQYFRGQRCGKGELVTPKGEVYVGFWNYDQCNGFGRLILPNGDYYEGDFVNNQASGEGKFVNHEVGIVYQGQFKNDMQDGKGKETYPDGSYYYGDFVADRKHGFGMFKFHDGSKYTGKFEKDEINGKGKLCFDFRQIRVHRRESVRRGLERQCEAWEGRV